VSILHKRHFAGQWTVAIALLTLLSLFPTPAFALKLLSRVTPESVEANGFSLTAQKQPEGTVRFTLVRDLTKARQFPAGSGMQVSRTAALRVYDSSGLRTICDLETTTRPGANTVTYRFTLAQDCVANSSLTLAEDDDYLEPKEEHILGGGTHYEFALGLFAGHSLQTPK
jgi:hypothetical protein